MFLADRGGSQNRRRKRSVFRNTYNAVVFLLACCECGFGDFCIFRKRFGLKMFHTILSCLQITVFGKKNSQEGVDCRLYVFDFIFPSIQIDLNSNKLKKKTKRKTE